MINLVGTAYWLNWLKSPEFCLLLRNQWRSQNAEKVTHIKGRLPGQAMILLNSVLFQNGNFS